MTGSQYVPRLIAWELTRACPLACKHCRAAARQEPSADELTTDECRRLLDNIASFARPIIILTGGEPMLRPDVYDIAAYARDLDLPVVMAPCGVLIDDEAAAKIAASGIRKISISLDGATADSHDAFRGVGGAFDSALRGIEAAKRAGIGFQINTTITRDNLGELAAIRDLAITLGASVFNPFLLVPTGRGRDLADQELSPEQYEQTLHWLAQEEIAEKIPIRVTCAPHYQRIIRQHYPDLASGRPATGCMGGKSFAFISHTGKVQICGFLDIECGDLRSDGLDFKHIWETSEVFRRVRDVDGYGGRCGYCEFRKVCGGCRARAYALTGDYLAEEPFCLYQPKRSPSRSRPDDLDRRILSVIQTDFPVAAEPYVALARQMGDTDVGEVFRRVGRMRQTGLIRRLGAVFDSASLGYASTLVAARVPNDRLDSVAQVVNNLPGVTHNYARPGVYNLWFTLTAESTQRIEEILADLRRQTGIEAMHSTPALKVYKIRAVFGSGPAAPARADRRREVRPLDEPQKRLVRLCQGDIPQTAAPFAELAAAMNWTRERVLAQLSDWIDAGVIRRFGAVVRHQRLGFAANAMVVFRVADERIDDVARRLADNDCVSHCYRRPPLEGFDYNLYAMVHAATERQIRDFVKRFVSQARIEDYDLLPSKTEFKKTSMRYFS